MLNIPQISVLDGFEHQCCHNAFCHGKGIGPGKFSVVLVVFFENDTVILDDQECRGTQLLIQAVQGFGGFCLIVIIGNFPGLNRIGIFNQVIFEVRVIIDKCRGVTGKINRSNRLEEVGIPENIQQETGEKQKNP